jgi:hypothetical protein
VTFEKIKIIPMETTKTPTEKIIDGLRQAAIELKKIQVQLSLGKAEARDKYEEARKKFKVSLDNVHREVKKSKELLPLLESLQVQFALGKAETKEVLEESRKKFASTLSELEKYLSRK